MDERTEIPAALCAGEERTQYDSVAANGKDSRKSTYLLVEDDEAVRDLVTNYLEDQDVRVICASRPSDVAPIIEHSQPDLMLLDLRLGREDGLDLLREIRARSDLPVIIITGHLQDAMDRVVGLELGADDYMIKPFSLRELLARIRAVLRRREAGRATTHRESKGGGLRFGSWRLDRRTRRLTDTNGEQVALTKGEYELLNAFVDAPQRPLSREHLLQATRADEDVFDRSIDVQVMRLRRKLQDSAVNPRIIRTERGVGYVFALPVAVS